MTAGKAAALGTILLGAFYVIVDPQAAACTTQQLLGMLADGANGVLAFLRELIGSR